MKRIVLLRHGESLWNKENRFTGWTDVDLSEKGVEEACKAGDALREAGFSFEAAYTSYLKRAVKTLNCVFVPRTSNSPSLTARPCSGSSTPAGCRPSRRYPCCRGCRPRGPAGDKAA